MTSFTAVAALAATFALTGHVTGSPSSSVTMKVVTRGKTPTEVTGFGAHAPAKCHAGPPFASAPFPKPLKIASNGRFSGQVALSGHGYTGSFTLSGKVAKNGKSASGILNIDKKAPLPIGECKTGRRSWTAKVT